MHLAKPLRTHSRLVTRCLLLLTLVLASVALTQCKMVTDTVTGVNAATVMKSKNCLIACQQDAQFQLNNENRLHEHNLEACNGDPTCIANENARDAAVIATIQAQLAQCQNNCHQQGGGSSGP